MGLQIQDLIQNLISGVSIGLTYGLMGLGVVLLWAAIKRINFANISPAMVSAYLFYTFYMQLHFGFVSSFILSVVVVNIIFGLLLKYMNDFMNKQGGGELEFVVITLMICVFLLAVFRAFYGGLPKPFPPVFGKSTNFIQIGKVSIQSTYINISIGAGITMVILHFLLKKTIIGKTLRATSQNVEVAQLMGINVNLTSILAFILSTLLVGIAGILLAPIYFVSLDLGGGSIGLKGFAAAVMGGLVDPYGTILGGIVIGVIENFSTLFISSVYRDVISFSIIVAILILKPQGIFNWTLSLEE